MDIQSEGNRLLQEHSFLFLELKEIPSTRNVVCRTERSNGNIIAKPRFLPEKYQWVADLFSRLRDHLQSLWNFFDSYSYWFDDITRAIIHIEERRLSKKSIIFLLERDIWSTDEVHGDYLIEKIGKNVVISYYRRHQRIRQFKLSPMTDTEIQTWICEDARKQIVDQFSILWEFLENEIETCIREEFSRLPTTLITTDHILKQYDHITEFLPNYPEAALMSLGRIAELWLLQMLEKEKRSFKEDLIRMAHGEGLINKNQVKLLQSIRREYNLLKHTLIYSINENRLRNLLKKMSILLNQ